MERGAYDEMRRLEDRHWWFRGKRRMVTPLLAEGLAAAEGATLLDVGCGTGGNLALVEQRFPAARTLGLDFDAGALGYCRGRRLRAGLLRGDGTRLPLADGSVDCVTALDIVEHFDDDGAVLAELARVLAPGGQLVLSVPMHPALWSPHDEFLHHKRRYRPGELEERLVAAGLAVERRRGFNFLLLLPIRIVRRLKRGKPATGTDFFDLPGPLNGLLAGLFVVEDWLVRLFGVTAGVSLMVRARKPRS
jgi:SAM-dependent methyltransferase